MKQRIYNDIRTWAEVSEAEKLDMLPKAMVAAARRVEAVVSDVRRVEELVAKRASSADEFLLENADFVAQTWINAERSAEKYPEKPCYLILVSAAASALWRLLDEQSGGGVIRAKADASGKRARLGCRIDKSADVKEHAEAARGTVDFEDETVARIDLERACADETDSAIVAAMLQYGRQTDAARAVGLTQASISNRLKAIRARMR